MTDEQMDARLHRAGENWRAAQTETRFAEPVEPIDITTRPRRPRLSRTGFLLTAATVAAALAGALAVVVTGLGGGPNRSADVAGLHSTVWRLVGYDHDQRLPNSFATLFLGTDGQLVADDSCDLVGAHVAVGGTRLDVSKVVSRFHECTDSVGEVTFVRGVDILRASPSYAIDGDELTIDGGGHTMHLVAAPDLPAPTLDVATLTGTDWKLKTVFADHGPALPVQGETRLRIDGDQLHAGDTCNTLTGHVQVNGRVVDVSNVATTEIGCSAEVQRTAAVVGAVLSGQATYVLTGTQLTLSRPGAGTLTYAWIPASDSATDPANLTNRTWHLLSAAGAPATEDLTLRIDDNKQIKGHLSGSDGCHTITTWVSLHRGWFTVQDSLNELTQDASCGTTVHSFLSTNPVVWSIHDGKLLIYGGGAQAFALVYGTSEPPDVTSGLVGPRWQESGYEQTSAGTSSGFGSSGPVSALAQVTFGKNGVITIWHRCYVNQGRVTIGADTLDISGVTLKETHPCPGTTDQAAEQQFNSVIDETLSGRSSWTISGGELHISKGGTVIDFDQ